MATNPFIFAGVPVSRDLRYAICFARVVVLATDTNLNVRTPTMPRMAGVSRLVSTSKAQRSLSVSSTLSIMPSVSPNTTGTLWLTATLCAIARSAAPEVVTMPAQSGVYPYDCVLSVTP